MKTLIKTTIIAAALFSSGLMAETAYENGLLSHPREGIMNFGEADSLVTGQYVVNDVNDILASHPVEGFYIEAPVLESVVRTHCLNVEPFTSLINHPREGVMGAADQPC